MSENFSEVYLQETIDVIERLDRNTLEKLAEGLSLLRETNGRLFVLGVGGSAAHASHAVNDFRKICQIETYAPTDNAAELTARTNDEGWESTFYTWLQVSRLNSRDVVLVLSVGGGNLEKNVSVNLINAMKEAKRVGAKIFGIVGRDGGYTASVADACVIIPTASPAHVTPHTEGLCSVVCHLLVSHPLLKVNQTKWESTIYRHEPREYTT